MTTITIDRAVVEQALEALESVYGDSCDALHALRTALAQQADPTDPGHDVDVLREHVRHLERRIRELHAQQAERVQDICPGCEATLGAACGRESCPKGWEAAPPQQAEPVEPVAWFYQNMYTEQEYLVWKKGTGGRNWRPLYTAPPQRKPLTQEEIAAEWRKASECAGKSEGAVTTSQFVEMFARAVERAHGIGEGA